MLNELVASSIAEALKIPHLIARLLVSRGFKTIPAVHTLLYASNRYEIDPFKMLGMDKAVEWILRVKENQETVFIFGDYDLDGLTSVSLLSRALTRIGIKNEWRLPSRFGSGYGLSFAAIDEMAEAKARNILTVDTGITANAEIAYAKTKGIRTMVIDHHQPSGEGLPDADVLLDPHQEADTYPNSDLCGVGVAYKFICALYKTLRLEAPKHFLELVALGTLADLVPMTLENRYFTHVGLSQMWDSSCVGIRELAKKQLVYKQFVGAQSVMFKIAPLLNAPGRMEKPDPALEMLLCDDKTKSLELIENLNIWNFKRKTIEMEVSKAVFQRVQELYPSGLPEVLIVDGFNWHVGVIGIVAAKLTQEFKRPAAVLSVQEDGIACSSARAVPGFNWHKALFDCRDLFVRWGGHETAAGFSIEEKNIEIFRNKMNLLASTFKTEANEKDKVEITEVALSEIEDSTLLWLSKLEPLIGSFPVPVFRAKNCLVKHLRELRGGHLYLEIEQNGSQKFAAIGFSMADKKSFILAAHYRVTVDFEITWNFFNGKHSVQLQIKNIL